MAKKTVRTKYIKSLVEDKDNLSKMLEESTKESINGLLDESVNRTLRQMLSESDDDSFEEEEVAPDEAEFDAGSDETGAEDTDQEDGGAKAECGPEGCDAEGESDGEEVWDKISDCKDEDGEYDLRGKDINTVLDLLKDMDPEVGLRIIKNDDGTATVEPDDEEETEFVIDIEDNDDVEPNDFEDDTLDGGDGVDTDGDYMDDVDLGDYDTADGDDETVYEIEVDDEDDDALNEELGYTDNYQSKTAMTLPSDNGDGNGAFNGGSRFDAGAPKGGANNKKRWVGHNGQNGGNAYSDRVNEEFDECGDGTIFEVVMDDGVDECGLGECGIAEGAGRFGMVSKHQMTKKHVGTNDNEDEYPNKTHELSANGELKSMNESRNRMNAINKKANEILAENKELRKIAAQIKDKLNEAVVINSSLAKVIRLITENSTTRDEKINILNRFNRVHTLNESRELYTQISNELKNAHAINSGNLLNKQLTEVKSANKNMIVETNLLSQSDDLKQILDLQERLSRI